MRYCTDQRPPTIINFKREVFKQYEGDKEFEPQAWMK